MHSVSKNIAAHKKSKMLLFAFLLLFFSEYFAQNTIKIKMPKGRIAFTSDGNLHDSDDWGATAFSLAFIHYAGLEKHFVHYDYNNHLGKSRASWEKIMDDAAKGGAKRFGLDVSKVFNNQTEQEDAIANFVKEAKKSSKNNPLWFICAGPMHTAYNLIKATPKEKRQFIHAISHSKWNEEHSHGATKMTWADMKKDFPTVVYHDLIDQNKSNGEDDFQSHIKNWQWLKESENPNWQWLYTIDDTYQVDQLERWKSNTEKHFDISDAGMTYWLITGGPNGGNDKAGWKEVKALFTNKPIENNRPTPEIKVTAKDYIFIEAESTKSKLQKWNRIQFGDANYKANASGFSYLEFTGNQPDSPKPNSPLKYKFTAPKDGNFRLLLKSSKRLKGDKADCCNTISIKMAGNFKSATSLSKNELKNYTKFFLEENEKTLKKEWHWAQKAENGAHIVHDLIYQFEKGQNYTLTLAGKSKHFNVDYLLFYNSDKLSLRDAKEFFSNHKK
ncbi:hypothetical protein [uncultured Polaribacter sp.]|uniref:hypothetical protein n=1 Tax=uncultured Polaribacter sp. TaxID=174711 RepID=UPI002618C3FF|nr:hypothetical protein [uncultured Polaribacter sp.]